MRAIAQLSGAVMRRAVLRAKARNKPQRIEKRAETGSQPSGSMQAIKKTRRGR